MFLHGERVGVAARSRRGAVHFAYDYDRSESATPLSLSLPVGQDHTPDISSWIDGLLPDNQRIRSRWARALGAASTDPFDLLGTQAGQECVGAVQFHPHPTLPDPRHESLVGLSASEIATMLPQLARDAEDDPCEGLGELRLSLPGAQPKMALRLTDDEWRLPTGTLATTHILKPQRAHLNAALRDSIAVNEHLCQTAATMLGLDAARTSLEAFETQSVWWWSVSTDTLTVTKCVAPTSRICAKRWGSPQSAGTNQTAARRLRRSSHCCAAETRRGDPRKFFLSMFYNWLIGNTDGHSKNYGVVLDGQHHRLAPLYDLSSTTIYVTPGAELNAPAMRFDGPSPTTPQQWAHTAARLGVDVAIDELQAMAEALPEAFESAAAQCPQWASDTARHVCEHVIAHARTTTRSTGDGIALFALE